MGYFRPIKDEIYTNKGGGFYKCLDVYEDGSAVMQNTASGWTPIAHGIVKHRDESIEWDYSTGGHWCVGEEDSHGKVRA